MRLGLIGFGNIATTLLALMARTGLQVRHLTVLTRPAGAVTARDRLAADFPGITVKVVTDAAGLLASRPDLVVECAGHAAVTAHLPQILRAGVDVVMVSIGALADAALEAELRRAATGGGARLILPAGAVGGIDLLSAIGAAGDLKVRYRGIKPPKAWRGTPAERAVDLDRMTGATVFFSGNARQAATDYPKNANVSATLALAGPGFEATGVELVADPDAPGNIHEYDVESPLARYSIRIANTASAGNAKTSVTTVWSVLREIRNRLGPVSI
ncbi:aspartate dehydrogenase [Paracoccus sp. (in: a-proteobacteria)]|uniref:aspartate dehydrogenase n=1 Tax=Paracoccus sp. TaxID=267 RepID=UPI003A8BB982